MPPLLRRKKPAPAAAPASDTEAPEAAAPEPSDHPHPEGAGSDTARLAAPVAARPRAPRRRLAHSTPVTLVRAAHPRLAVLTAAGLAVAAALSGRPGREVALVFATVLVGQAVLGWCNDLVDRRRDERRRPSGKPIADGYLDPGTAWFALLCGVLTLVPLAIANGVVAGCLYLGSVVIGILGNLVLRRGWLSWVSWAAAYALYPAFLSYGGWGGQAQGAPPEPAMVGLAALLGIGVHVLCALPGLVADHEDHVRHLPLRLAMRLGATRVLALATVWTVAAVVGLLAVGSTTGLRA